MLVTMILSTYDDQLKDALAETVSKLFPKTVKSQLNSFVTFITLNQLNQFYVDFETTNKSPEKPSLLLNPDLLALVLDLVEVIRIYNQNAQQKVELNYLPIAAAAQFSGLHANAILYGELFMEHETYSRKCPEDQLPLDGLRTIMIPSYESLEVFDAVKPFLDLNKSRHKYYTMENAWEFAYLEAATGVSDRMMVKRTDTTIDSNTIPVNYESIWRMSDWGQLQVIALDAKSRSQVDGDHQKSHCLALKSLALNEGQQAKHYLNIARSQVIDNLARTSLDCIKGVYGSLAVLRQIQQIEDVLEETRSWKDVLAKWLRFDELQANSFEQQEQILVQRITILQSRRGQKNVPSLVDKQMRLTILELVRLAKEERNFKAAVVNLKRLERLELEPDIRSQMILEDGHLQFIAGHSKLANHLYMQLINDDAFRMTFSRISALLLMAEYLTDNLMVSPNEILQKYLLPAEKFYMEFVKSMPRVSETLKRERVKIFNTTAKFADMIYTQRNNYLKSAEYMEKKKWHEETVAEYKAIDLPSLVSSKDVAAKTRAHTLRQTIVLEECQLKTVTKERENYLHLAIKMYTKSCVSNAELNDLQISRIVSLWFTNISDNFVGDFLRTHLPDIPSYKFLMILPQIAARLSHSDLVLTESITEVLIRCCEQHPHQAIFHVLALFNAHADNKRAQMSSSMETRIGNAKGIIEKLRTCKAVNRIVAAAQNLSIALIKLANRTVKDASDNQVGGQLTDLSDMHRIAAPTVEIPVRIDRNYAEFPRECIY